MKPYAPNDNELELQFDLHRGEAWMVKDGDMHRLGPLGEVCEEMCRFLAEIDYGDACAA